jgi:hypothetical protein
VTRYQYNRQVTPPAPFVHVVLSQPDGSGALPEVAAQLDTVADFTVLPATLVEALRLVQIDSITVEGFGGITITVPTYLVRLAVRGHTNMIIEALCSSAENYVLLGRDVLNHYRIRLDGPGGVLEID